MQVIIETFRESYGTEDIHETMTIQELKEFLDNFDDDAKIF